MFRLTDLAIHRKARALGEHWDAVIRRSPLAGEPPSADLTELIHYMHGVWDSDRRPSPTGDPTLDRLLARHQEINTKASTTPALPFPASQRQPTLPRPLPAFSPRLRIAMIIAALALLSLAAGIAFGALDLGWNDDGGRPAGPAIQAPASPSPEVTVDDDPGFSVTIPADALPLPSDGIAGSGIGHFTIPPGTSSSWEPTCCTGPMVDYVISGTLTVRAEAATQVLRADGGVEEIPAATDVVLGPGDAIVSRVETPAVSVNNGTEPVELLNWGFFAGDSSQEIHPGWITGMAAGQGPIELLDEPLMVELSPIEVRSGDVVAPAASGYLYVVPVTAGSFAAGNDDGSFRIAGDPARSTPCTCSPCTRPAKSSPRPRPETGSHAGGRSRLGRSPLPNRRGH